MTEFAKKYGPWALVIGASVGGGAEFCRQIAAEGVNVVLVARGVDKMQALAKELQSEYGVETRVAGIDLDKPGADRELFAATEGLEIGLLVYNAGSTSDLRYFIDVDLNDSLALIHRNCIMPVRTVHHYAPEMVKRKRGGVIVVTSGAAFMGCGRLAIYNATKAFELMFTESMWSELRRDGVDAVCLVAGLTDTPTFAALLEPWNLTVDALRAQGHEIKAPDEVARAGLEHLTDGPTWNLCTNDPAGPALLGTFTRREAVEGSTKYHDDLLPPLTPAAAKA